MEASAKPREASARRWKAGALPISAAWCGLMLACGRTGAVGCATPGRITIVRETSCRSAGIDKGAVCSPQAHDNTHRGATGRTAGRKRLRGLALGRLAIAGVSLHDQQADGRERDSTAGMEQAEVANFHEAIGQDVLEEPAEKFHAVEVGRAEACTAHFPGGEGDRAVRKADEAVVGDGNLEDIGGQGSAGGVAVVIGLAMDIPRDGPDLWIDLLQQAGLAHVVFAERAGDGGERFDRDKEVGKLPKAGQCGVGPVR
jgi:hypothetical protein